MKYTTLEQDEIRLIRALTWLTIRKHLVFFACFIIALYTFSGIILGLPFPSSADFYVRPMTYFINLAPHLFAVAVLGYFVFVTIKKILPYRNDIISNQKRLHIGILTKKKIKDNHTYFYMDGYRFLVNMDDFEKYQEGEKLVFHICPFSGHLLKVASLENTAQNAAPKASPVTTHKASFVGSENAN